MAGAFKSLKGHFLLDDGKLSGSFFQRTVVLLCEHDKDGAFGLVLNRLAGTSFGEALIADMPAPLKKQPLYIGGPVQQQSLSFIHPRTSISTDDASFPVVIGHSLDELIDCDPKEMTPDRLRIFAGYAGWSPGQLDDEMQRHSWLTYPATLDLIFSDPVNLWQRILGRFEKWEYRLLMQSPENLSSN